MNDSPNRMIISFRLQPKLVKKIEDAAKREKVTKTKIVETALEKHFKLKKVQK